ncbi:UNVERIFIED_CONTAM: hypothetical protein Slati_2922800 [Sesamum latifolium]|uniref:Uncharacterized protein n=1 Tax=Sesamum latifolium TaxID=2727402 RepID=A0AAW2VCX0_9LAMI
MASQGARADPVASREESGESVEGSVAPASAGGVEVGREGVGADVPRPPGGAPVVGLPPEYAQIFQMAFQAQAQAQTQKMGATEFEGTLDPEIAERWWEKVEDVMNLISCTLENRLKYVVSLFVGNALIWWRSGRDTGGRCYRFEQGLRPEIRKGLAVRITDFKTLVESAVRMEEAVTEEKKRLEEKRKSTYTVGESSRSTKRGTGRSFSLGGGNFSRGGPAFRAVAGQDSMDQWALIGFARAVHLLCLLVDQVEDWTELWSGTSFSTELFYLWKTTSGPCWRRDDIARTCYHCGASGTQSQSSIGSSGRGTERGRGRGRGRGTSNRDNDQAIGGGMRGPGAQITQGQTQARIYNMTREEAPASNDVISDLIVMDLKEFDVILGMDWLAQHRAVVDCYKKEVMIEFSGESRVVFVGDRQVVPICVISAVEARRLMLEGCEAYLAHVIDTKKVNPMLEEIPVVRDFPEVFPDDLPGLPPHREVDFAIETLPGVAPISIAPYRMAPVELQELKKQLEELLEKGLSSQVLWGALCYL